MDVLNTHHGAYSGYSRLGFEAYEDPSAARRITVDSLAYIVNLLGLTPDSLDHVLRGLGVHVEEGLIKVIKGDVAGRVGKVSVRELTQYQYMAQRLLKLGDRKLLAAYYTGGLGVEVISRVIKSYFVNAGKRLVIADPFMGSGILLHNIIRAIGADNVKLTWGVELDPVSCILGYATLLGLVNGDVGRVLVKCGDAFRIIWGSPLLLIDSQAPFNNTDVIVTNPPFTRWELLPGDYRMFLESLVNARGYSKYVTRRQLNLQAISLFLIDSVLARDGLLVSVLPASTLYTIYGEGIRRMLMERYGILAMIQRGGGDSAFSVDSGFKEVILVARKNWHVGKTAFVTINDDGDIKEIKFTGDGLNIEVANKGILVHEDINSLPHLVNQNWLLLFNPELKPLIKSISGLMSRGLLRPFREVFGEDSIVRGVEMYGPDFFLIPNNHFSIEEVRSDHIAIKQLSTGDVLEIPREFLTPALRKPSLYKSRLVVEDPGYYLLSIPPVSIDALPRDVGRYIEVGVRLGTTRTAERAFGRYWYSHVYRQIKAKRPFGHVFIPDKVDAEFRDRGVYAFMSWNPLTATKNFYIVMNREYAPALTLWLNSTIFLALLINGSRRIGKTWTRYLEEDILNLPTPSRELMSRHKEEAENLAKELSYSELPPFKAQAGAKAHYSIDYFILEILGVRGAQREWLMEYMHQLLRYTTATFNENAKITREPTAVE